MRSLSSSQSNCACQAPGKEPQRRDGMRNEGMKGTSGITCRHHLLAEFTQVPFMPSCSVRAPSCAGTPWLNEHQAIKWAICHLHWDFANAPLGQFFIMDGLFFPWSTGEMCLTWYWQPHLTGVFKNALSLLHYHSYFKKIIIISLTLLKHPLMHDHISWLWTARQPLLH